MKNRGKINERWWLAQPGKTHEQTEELLSEATGEPCRVEDNFELLIGKRYASQKKIDQICNQIDCKNPKEKKSMSILDELLETNKEALGNATKQKAADVTLKSMKKIAKKRLPPDVANYIDTPIGSLLLANIISGVVPHVTDNELAEDLSKSAVVCAYLEVIESLKIKEIAESFVKAVSDAE